MATAAADPASDRHRGHRQRGPEPGDDARRGAQVAVAAKTAVDDGDPERAAEPLQGVVHARRPCPCPPAAPRSARPWATSGSTIEMPSPAMTSGGTNWSYPTAGAATSGDPGEARPPAASSPVTISGRWSDPVGQRPGQRRDQQRASRSRAGAAARRQRGDSPGRAGSTAAVRNAAEKIAPDCRSAAALAAVNARLRNSRSGQHRLAAARPPSDEGGQQRRAAASRATVTAVAPAGIAGADQAPGSATAPPATSAAPGRSSRPRGRGSRGSRPAERSRRRARSAR